MNLVSQINAKPRTQGLNVFDNALLQSGGGREKIAQASSANQGLKGNLDAASQAVQNKIGRADDLSTPDVDESAGAIGQTNKAQADAYKQVQDALGAWKSGFEPKVATAQKNLVDLQNRVTGDISDNPLQLNDETMSLLGLNPRTRLYNNNLSDYLTQASPSDINAANVASPEDYARYGALADLSGDKSNVLDQANISQAGTAPAGMKANSQKLQDDIAQSQQKFQEDYQKADTLAPFIQNRGGNGGDLRGAMSGKSPQYIEQVILPDIISSIGSDGYSYASADAQALKSALDQWKASQGYGNVVNATQGLTPRLIRR